MIHDYDGPHTLDDDSLLQVYNVAINQFRLNDQTGSIHWDFPTVICTVLEKSIDLCIAGGNIKPIYGF